MNSESHSIICLSGTKVTLTFQFSGILHGPVSACRAEDRLAEDHHCWHAAAPSGLPFQLRGHPSTHPHRQGAGSLGKRQNRKTHHETGQVKWVFGRSVSEINLKRFFGRLFLVQFATILWLQFKSCRKPGIFHQLLGKSYFEFLAQNDRVWMMVEKRNSPLNTF